MSQRTALYQAHCDAGAKMVEFAGWQMPVNYGSQINEHVAVRTNAGMFDVSHMTVIDVSGAGAQAFLQRVIANDVAKLDLWGALYGALLNAQGGVIDDLIVYRLPDSYRVVVNASTRDKVLGWFAEHVQQDMSFAEQDLAMIAVQGPNALDKVQHLVTAKLDELAPFSACAQGDWLIGRTGYTGEDGVEIILPGDDARTLWQQLLDQDVQPAGLGARDTLRLEAGLNLYGQDMDENTSPLVSNIAWTVAWQPADRDFIGRDVLEAQRQSRTEKLTGLIYRDKGVLRHGQRVVTEHGDGVITSGTYSPTLQYSIALARLPRAATGECQVELRGKLKPAQIVKPPFVRHGKILV